MSIATDSPVAHRSDTSSLVTDNVDGFAEHLFASSNAFLEVLGAYLGDRLGYYRELTGGPLTPGELAARTGTHPRYAREWLEYQACLGWVRAEPMPAAGPGVGTHRFALPTGGAEVLTDVASLSYLAPLARMVAASAVQLPALLEAYRTGGGVSWERFGADARESQADMNRPWFEHRLPEAFAGVERLHEALSRPGARVAEIGFGGGWSSVALARAYPQLTVDGYDIDEASVELARRNAAEAGVADRVRFHPMDAAEINGSFDVVLAFECIHDIPHPVEVLAAARRAAAPAGLVVVMDEAVGEEFVGPGDEVERLMYGLSTVLCLPDSMSHAGSAATGTVMRPATLRRYAVEAGFSGIEVLPIEDFGFWRFYRLHD
jgi:SAM-dependent methyltransferase